MYAIFRQPSANVTKRPAKFFAMKNQFYYAFKIFQCMQWTRKTFTSKFPTTWFTNIIMFCNICKCCVCSKPRQTFSLHFQLSRTRSERLERLCVSLNEVGFEMHTRDTCVLTWRMKLKSQQLSSLSCNIFLGAHEWAVSMAASIQSPVSS